MRLLLFAFVLYLAQVTSPAKFLLEGRVLKAGTSDPVPSASIVAARVGGTLEDYRASVTDSSGRFSFTDLTAGTYRVFATRTGYLRAEYGSPGGRAGTGITLDARQARVDVTLSMTPFGIIA